MERTNSRSSFRNSSFRDSSFRDSTTNPNIMGGMFVNTQGIRFITGVIQGYPIGAEIDVQVAFIVETLDKFSHDGTSSLFSLSKQSFSQHEWLTFAIMWQLFRNENKADFIQLLCEEEDFNKQLQEYGIDASGENATSMLALCLLKVLAEGYLPRVFSGLEKPHVQSVIESLFKEFKNKNNENAQQSFIGFIWDDERFLRGYDTGAIYDAVQAKIEESNVIQENRKQQETASKIDSGNETRRVKWFEPCGKDGYIKDDYELDNLNSEGKVMFDLVWEQVYEEVMPQSMPPEEKQKTLFTFIKELGIPAQCGRITLAEERLLIARCKQHSTISDNETK